MSKRRGKSKIASSLKAVMRELHLSRVGEIPEPTRSALAAMVAARLESLDEYASAQTVMFYWPVPGLGEVDFSSSIRAALRAGKNVCLPRIDWKTGRMTARRIRSLTRDLELDPARPKLNLRQPVAAAEPVSAAQIDLILVPGVAFDAAGRRLGRGAGFYDRFLFGLPTDRPLRVALAFDEQVSEGVAIESHDQPVHLVLTPTRTIRVKPARPPARKLARKPRSGRSIRQAKPPTRARPGR